MRWSYVEAFLGLRVDPTAEDATARKRESVSAGVIDHGQLKVAVERCGRDRHPCELKLSVR